ncbi:MAG: hypothetical protein R3F59_38295 [Myxococcota bacterium]
MTADPWDDVAAAVAAADPHRALAEALDAWRAAPSPEGAELVEALSARLPGAPLGGVDEWGFVQARADPADVPRLLAVLPTYGPVQGLSRLRLVLGRGADPRTSAALVGWLEDRPRRCATC